MAKYINREELVAWLQRIPLKDLSDGRGLRRHALDAAAGTAGRGAGDE